MREENSHSCERHVITTTPFERVLPMKSVGFMEELISNFPKLPYNIFHYRSVDLEETIYSRFTQLHSGCFCPSILFLPYKIQTCDRFSTFAFDITPLLIKLPVAAGHRPPSYNETTSRSQMWLARGAAELYPAAFPRSPSTNSPSGNATLRSRFRRH